MFLLCSVFLNLARLCCKNSDFALVLGAVGVGHSCPPLFRDPHPTCAKCRGVNCITDVTCDICKDWSAAQWEAFLKKCSYGGRCKSRPSGSTLPTAPPTLPPSASAEGGGGVMASGGGCDSAASSLPGVGVAGPSWSQESPVLTGSAPPSVDSSASAMRSRRSRSREVGGSSEGRSRSHSSRSSLPRSRDSRKGRHRARSWSGGSRDGSRESRSRSTTRSWSRGCRCSRRDSSRSPSARVRSRLSRSLSSDRYRVRRVHSRSRCDHSRSYGSCYRSRDQSLLSSDHSRSRDRSWRPGRSRRDRVEVVVASRNRGNPGSRVESAPAVAGSSSPRPMPSLQDLARLFLNLSGSHAQWDAVVGSAFLAAGFSGAGVLIGPAAPEPSAVPSLCSSASVPAPGGGAPTGAASATGSAGRHKCAWESPCSERHCRRSCSRERSRSGKKCREGRSPSPARSSRPARLSASSSSASSDEGLQAGEMPPPPAGRPGIGGGRSGGDRSPRPGPSGQGLASRSLPVAEPSRSEYGGRYSPAPSGATEDGHSSTFESLDLVRDDSFRSVLRFIREFHSLEEPASVDPNWCKTSLASVYGLQSESSPALHLPLSPLLRSLLEDTNSALAMFVEDQTVHGFLPVPGRRHRKYYRTSSSSFPGPYSVPPGLDSITLEKVV